MRERESAKVQDSQKDKKIFVTIANPLDKTIYNIPLTLKTYVSPEWKKVNVQQGKHTQQLKVEKDEKGTYVLYQAHPNGEALILSGV